MSDLRPSWPLVIYFFYILFPFLIGVGLDDVDFDRIQEPVPHGVFKSVSPSGEQTYIAFDRETTDLSKLKTVSKYCVLFQA